MNSKHSRIGFYIALYGTVFIIAWIGAFKFTPGEAKAISHLIEHSPFLSWMYSVGSIEGVSKIIGVGELSIAALLALYPISKKASLLGGLLATGLFLTTLTFLLTTPGTLNPESVFPSLLGAFLIKDVVSLGVVLVVVAESWIELKHSRSNQSA
ncbi:DUF417 family protein [Pseudomonas sp. S9]|uniref:DUF417 family protein n=1 Tax=Pseudomonas sp. S9 TaxID=686578 RepID=UPI00025570CD|nr:DUF417 family protein [Pseudomonas sp. S9]